MSLKIVSLKAENIKRLVAVEITPTGNIVAITGKNGQGKSSILDAIWWALCGASHIQGKPVRKGEDKALVELNLGDIIVTRKFSATETGDYITSLAVTNAEGLKFSKPQDVLDKMLDTLAFDPLEFARAEPKRQLAMLRKFVPSVDFDLIELQNKTDYDRRTILNRAVKEHESAAKLIAIPDIEDVGDVDVAAIESQIDAAATHNADIERRKANREAAAEKIKNSEALASRMVAEAADMEQRAADRRAEAQRLTQETKDLQDKLNAAEALPAPLDVTDLRAKANAARAHNDALKARAAKIAEKSRLEKLAKDAQDAADKHTKDRDERIAARDAAIAAAQIPVPGIAFGDGEVLLNGVPFEQASYAEQLRASVAIAMADNPKLRVIRIRDGSHLDSDGMAVLAEMAKEKDFQVWMECVTDGQNLGVVIEDGHVKVFSDAAEQKQN